MRELHESFQCLVIEDIVIKANNLSIKMLLFANLKQSLVIADTTIRLIIEKCFIRQSYYCVSKTTVMDLNSTILTTKNKS